ncbi:MAG: PD40 domain-containing protein [Deltaproteobacteria bacterium]|nr:PD40 domain-containing protein [Deltaproteobacteria bacterium]MBN2671991.1 PD40 domain-containing protein [Deltaproteobacteria bacterium]
MKQYLQNKRRALIFFVWTSGLLLMPGVLWAGDPAVSYRTLKTEHFNIHYDVPLEALARDAAKAAENAYILVTSTLEWDIEGKVEMRIVDSTDYANGLASPYRYPYIELYATPPDIDSPLQYHDDWLFFLIVHELTHETHIQMQYGVSRVYNTIFGDLYLPNSMQPTWFIEGLAVMLETRHTNRGRIRSPHYQMVMRTHALQGTLQTLGEASNSTSAFPRGEADYVYGAMFLHFLEQRIGDEAIFTICHRYAAQPLPYGLNRIFEEVSGIPLTQLYEEWLSEVSAQAADEAVRIQSEPQGITDSVRLTASGEAKGHPILAAHDTEIMMPVSDGESRGRLVVLSAEDDTLGHEKRRLVRIGADADISMTASGDVYYAYPAPYKDNYRFRDLFVLEAGKTVPRRLTFGKRVKEAAVSRQGDNVALVTNQQGRTRLELVDGTGRFRRVLLPATKGTQYYTPTFSPDGRTIAVVIRKDARVDLAVVDVATAEWFFVTADIGLERSPRFSPDGRYLLFTSDVSGTFNVMAREMSSGQLKQVTNVTTGAMAPALTADNRTIYFLQYYSEGWDLHRAHVSLDDLPAFLPPSKTAVAIPDQFSVSAKKEPYNPLPTFRPHAWELGFTGLGLERAIHIATYWEDASLLHQMSVGFDYEFTARNPSVNAMYLYNGLLPQFQLQFAYAQAEVPDGYLVNGVPAAWTRASYTGSVGFSIPILGVDDNHYLSLGYTLNESGPMETLSVEVDPNGDLPEMPTQYFRTGVRVSWSYSDLFSGPLSVSPEDGRSLFAGVTLYHPALGGNREQVLMSWSWREYRRAPWKHHHVFALGLGGEAYLSNPNHLTGMAAGGYTPQPLLDAVLNESSVGLPRIRGYEANSILGDHYHSLRMEYRFPIWRPDVAYQTFPVFFRYVYGAVFSDNLLMSYDQFDMEDYYTSAGAELVWAFILGYHMPVVLRTGFARGMMEHGINEFILVIGGSY